MRIGFYDFIGFSYDHRLVETTALGGTQALVATLAYYLARAGHSVTVHAIGSHRYTLDGVNYVGLSGQMERQDLGVLVNLRYKELCLQLKYAMGDGQFALWWHGNRLDIKQCEWVSEVFDFVLVVSGYAYQKNIDRIPLSKLRVIRNFLPVLPQLFAEHSTRIDSLAKRPHVFAYIGNATRGLENVPDIASRLRSKAIDFKVRIFSGVDLYRPFAPQWAVEPDLLARCRKDPNVEFVKKVGKRELLLSLTDVTYLLMPNSCDESFCLSLLEAMYKELICIATTRAAIPETSGGFAYLANLPDPESDLKMSPFDLDAYMEVLLATMDAYPAAAGRLAAQKSYVLDNFSPEVVLSQWLALCQT